MGLGRKLAATDRIGDPGDHGSWHCCLLRQFCCRLRGRIAAYDAELLFKEIKKPDDIDFSVLFHPLHGLQGS